MNADKKISVLMADDSRSILINLKEILRSNFSCEQVVSCKDGTEAWENIQKSNFDLILSGSMLPGISGEDLLSNVRENEETKDIPFLMLSNKKDKDSVMKAISSGATGYIIKPFSEDDIIKRIEGILQVRAKSLK